MRRKWENTITVTFQKIFKKLHHLLSPSSAFHLGFHLILPFLHPPSPSALWAAAPLVCGEFFELSLLSLHTNKFHPVSLPFGPRGCWCLLNRTLGCCPSAPAECRECGGCFPRGTVSPPGEEVAPLSPMSPSSCLARRVQRVFGNTLGSCSLWVRSLVGSAEPVGPTAL